MALDFKKLLNEERMRARKEKLTEGSEIKTRESHDKVPLSMDLPKQSFSPAMDFPRLTLEPNKKRIHQSNHIGASVIQSLYFIPDWINKTEENAIMDMAYSTRSPWISLSGRRVQCWGGQPNDRSNFVAEPLPPWLDDLCAALVEAGVFPTEVRPNHVLLNEYARGEGIFAHSDGPMYYPKTATLSLSGSAVMTFEPHIPSDKIGQVSSDPVCEVILRPRSLVVFTEDAYTHHRHAIAATTSERVGDQANTVNLSLACAQHGDVIQRAPVRVSLTFRHLPCP